MSQQYDAVWRWIDWPGRQGKPDTGIDLVARERGSGEYTAIQCKFYEPTHQLRKEDIDSFFTASGKNPFTNRIIISTTDRWGRNAEDALEDQTIPVQRIGLAEIADSPIDWDIAWVDLRAMDPTCVVRQVNEKYGVLRFTADPSIDDDVVYQRFSVLIAAAEQRSATVCERCGAPAQLCMTNRGTWPWHKTVCSACSDQIAKKAAADTYPFHRVVSNDL